MVGEFSWQADARKSRQMQLYPELEFGNIDSILAVDKVRRQQGQEPTSFGRDLESAYARSGADLLDDNPDAAPRGAPDQAYDILPQPSSSPFRVAEQQHWEEMQGVRDATTSSSAGAGIKESLGFLGGSLGSGLLPDSAPTPLRMAVEEGLRPSNYLGAAFRGLSFVPKAGTATRLAVEGAAAVGGGLAGGALYDATEGLPEGVRGAASLVGSLAGNIGTGAAAGKLARGAPAALEALNSPGPLLAGEATARAEALPGGENLVKAAKSAIRALSDRYTPKEIRRATDALDYAAANRAAPIGGKTRTILEEALGSDVVAAMDALAPMAQDGKLVGRPRVEAAMSVGSVDQFADIATRVAEANATRAANGQPGDISGTLKAVNGFFRGIQATGEMSYATIQGAIGMVADPKGYGKAITAATKSWADPEVYGSYLQAFSRGAAAKGNLDAAQWAERGLRLTGADTEFAVGQGVPRAIQRIGDLPVARQVRAVGRAANRGFGTFGDAMRLELADTLLDEARAAGRTIDDAALETIRHTANRVTGTADKAAFGSWGEVLMFAPRFFQSKLETLAQVAKPGYEGALSRRTFGRYVGTMLLATVAANEALGNDYDYTSPMKQLDSGKWIKNPQFMRIRTLGRDWSLFGTWDSMMGLAISLGTGDLPGAARSTLSSPIVAKGWDLIKGEDFMGNPTRNTAEGEPLGGLVSADTAKLAGKSLLPFAADSAGQAVAQLAKGDLPQAVGSGLTAAFGLKGTPLSPTEQLDRVTPGGSFYGAPPSVREQVKAEHPELWKVAVEKGSDRRQLSEQRRAETDTQQLASDERFQAGDISATSWRDALGERELALRAKRDEIYAAAKESGKNPDLISRYFKAIDDAAGPDGTVDWDKVDQWRAALDPQDDTFIDDNTGLTGTPLVKEYRNLKREMDKSGYYDLRDKAWAELQKQHPEQLGSLPKDFYEWRSQEIKDLAEQGVAYGYPRAIAMQLAADKVAQYKTVTGFNEFYRTEYRHQWVMEHPDLAQGAWGFALLDPDKAEKAFLSEQLAP